MPVVKTRATLTLEVHVGTFGEDWHVAGLEKDAEKSLATAIAHLAQLAQKSGIVITNVETKGLVVIFDKKD